MRLTMEETTSPSSLIFFVTASGSPPTKLVNCPFSRPMRVGILQHEVHFAVEDSNNIGSVCQQARTRPATRWGHG